MFTFILVYLVIFLIFVALLRITYLVVMDDSDPKEKQKVVTFKKFFKF